MSNDENSPWDLCGTISTFLSLEDISRATAIFSEFESSSDTPVLQLLADLKAKGYERICMPLTNEKWKQRWQEMCILSAESIEGEKQRVAKEAEAWRMMPGFKKDEVTITKLDEAEGIIAMSSEWLELDSDDAWVRHDAEIALDQELSYAGYLNILTVILPPPRNREHVASYARTVNTCLKMFPYISLSVRLPIYHPVLFQPTQTQATQSVPGADPLIPVAASATPTVIVPPVSGNSLDATWEMWDVIRTMCEYNPRLTLTLDLSIALPTTLGVLSKWAAESVQHIYLPSSTFIANVKGYPVLPKATQQFIKESMIHQPVIILAGVSEGHHARGGEMVYLQYVRHLERTSPVVQAAKRPGTVENFAKGYQDYLQAPLQPLMDNLASVTYQTFEQDPVKYMLYEEAMVRAFSNHPEGNKLVICIAGAGRGPLVSRCFYALTRTRRKAKVFVIEKNPNASVTLQQRQNKEWRAQEMQLLFGDMRLIDVPEKVDVLVSELLGSFGDNELCPECLDGAMRFLKPNGISIPSSYTAHLAPLSSAKLYQEARSTKNERSLETPYVVMFQAVNILSGTKNPEPDQRYGPQVQECWEFEHPRKDVVVNAQGLPFTNSHNARSANLRFYIPHAGILHGLAGYFEAILYDNIGLSIHPLHKDQVSKDMLSWFPLFFPFREPLYLPSNSELQVSIWRVTRDRKVWYEWHAESFMTIPSNGNSNVGGQGSPEEDTLPNVPSTSILSPSSSVPWPLSLSSPFMGPPSPLLEPIGGLADISANLGTGVEGYRHGLIKIGQTGLHNPGGRSSWIGL